MLSVVFVIAALAVSGIAAVSTVVAVCETGPKATLTITGAVSGYTVFSAGTGCPSTTVPSSGPLTYTMTASATCTFTLTTPFTLVIQQTIGFVSSIDEVFAVTCGTASMSPQVQSVSLTTTALATATAVSALGATVTFAVVDASGAPLSSVSVGQSVKLKASIPLGSNAAIGFKISSVTFKVGSETAVSIITAGCSVVGVLMPSPENENTGLDGVIEVAFDMFIPITSGTYPETAPTVVIESTVALCVGNCEPVSCVPARKRRSANEPMGTDVLTLTRPLIILPPGMSVVTRNETINNNGRTEAQEMPIFSTALIATVVALGVVLALCILVLVFMFCRLRRHMDASDSKKSAFENKAFN